VQGGNEAGKAYSRDANSRKRHDQRVDRDSICSGRKGDWVKEGKREVEAERYRIQNWEGHLPGGRKHALKGR